MKKIYALILILFSLKSFAQGIPCNPNTFWITTGSQIEEFVINGSAITSNGVIVTAVPPGNSLAWCNNLNGGTFSPTFYTNADFDKAAYYDGTAWITYPALASCLIVDAGGAGNYLYYTYAGIGCIEKFNGTSFVQLYSGPTLVFTIADVAVDDAGNAWCLMGAFAPVTDSIVVISPAGQVIHQFAFSLNTNNGYGCFLLNGVLYIGLGSANPVYPNTLLPVTFTSTAAVAGTPLSFSNYAIDLASCNAGIPLGVTEHSPVAELTIYPTIASDYITCHIPVKVNASIKISITDVSGKIIYMKTSDTSATNQEIKLDISNFSNGVYFVAVDTGKEKAVKKFIKN